MVKVFQKNHLNLKYYTTTYIAGTVLYALFPTCKEGVMETFNRIDNEIKLPFFVLGKGSNVIINDKDLDYVAILTHYLNSYEVKEDEVIVDAGVAMTSLAQDLLINYNLKGFEWAYGLPGSVGGGVFMNARVYGKEFNDVVKWVEVYDYKEKSFKTLSLAECEYGYKQSIFQHKPYFIFRACLKLTKAPSEEIHELYKEAKRLKQERIDKGQYIYPSPGSAFKNDYSIGTPTGRIIESLNLKEYSVGGAKVSKEHANFLVNATHNATFEEYKKLIEDVKAKVKESLGYEIETEINFLP